MTRLEEFRQLLREQRLLLHPRPLPPVKAPKVKAPAAASVCVVREPPQPRVKKTKAVQASQLDPFGPLDSDDIDYLKSLGVTYPCVQT